MVPNPAQRTVIWTYGVPVLTATVLLVLPLIPSTFDVMVGVVGMGSAAIGGFRYAKAA